jgi:hypothetical protein
MKGIYAGYAPMPYIMIEIILRKMLGRENDDDE